MMREMQFIQSMHNQTQRNYIERITPEKVRCCEVAKKFDKDFWDGDRKYGYGGYIYDGRWKDFASRLIKYYKLPSNARILDVGCGKGFLLYEFKELLPECEVVGFDISRYAIDNAIEYVRKDIFVYDAKDVYPFEENYFDLVTSINTIHNLYLYDLMSALRQIERVGQSKYIVVESYRNEQEKFNLVCWNLTGECYFTPLEWKWFFEQFGYTGDYEFIFFE